MKKNKLIVATSALSLLIGVNCIHSIGSINKNTNSNNRVSAKANLGPVKFDQNYLWDAENGFDPQWPVGPHNINKLYYHNESEASVKTLGSSVYENIDTGKTVNKQWEFYQWSYVNGRKSGKNLLSQILIIELDFTYTNDEGQKESKNLDICVVPIIANNHHYTGLFNVYVTDVPTSKIPDVNASVWTLYMTTTKKSKDNQRANGFHYWYEQDSLGNYSLQLRINNNKPV